MLRGNLNAQEAFDIDQPLPDFMDCCSSKYGIAVGVVFGQGEEDSQGLKLNSGT